MMSLSWLAVFEERSFWVGLRVISCQKCGRVANGAAPRQSVAMNVTTFSPFKAARRVPDVTAFHRSELGLILGLYGRMVAAGEWRDYGISSLRVVSKVRQGCQRCRTAQVAVFSTAFFRRSTENPLYRVEKRPKLRDRQGQYAVIGVDGQVLKRGHDLKLVLRVLERKLIRAVK